jgi:hypothetical protein
MAKKLKWEPRVELDFHRTRAEGWSQDLHEKAVAEFLSKHSVNDAKTARPRHASSNASVKKSGAQHPRVTARLGAMKARQAEDLVKVYWTWPKAVRPIDSRAICYCVTTIQPHWWTESKLLQDRSLPW